MKYYSFLVIGLVSLFCGCRKEANGEGRVAIYLLASFTAGINNTTVPATHTITNAVLEATPLVGANNIRYYRKSNYTFYLNKNLEPRFTSLGADKAFAVTVNGAPVYYGRFHPGYMSSVIIGLATIDPIMVSNEKELSIQYLSWDDNDAIKALDKRNDPQLLGALKATGRLK